MTDYTLKEMKHTFRRYQKQAARPFKYGFLFVVIIGVFMQLSSIYNWIDIDLLMGLIFSSGLILIGLIGLTVNHFYVRQKISVDTLFKEISESLHDLDERKIDYQAYPKHLKKVYREGGLFTRNAFAKIRYAFIGKTRDGTPFHLMNVSLIVSTGSASSEIFKGMYLIIEQENQELLQIKTRYRPSMKGIRFDRIREDEEGFKLYYESNRTVDEMALKHWHFKVSKLHKDLNAKHSYFGLSENSIHYAFSQSDIPYKLKTADEAEIRSIVEQFKTYLEIPERLLETI